MNRITCGTQPRLRNSEPKAKPGLFRCLLLSKGRRGLAEKYMRVPHTKSTQGPIKITTEAPLWRRNRRSHSERLKANVGHFNTQTLQIKSSQIYKFKIPKTYEVKPRPENAHQDVHQVYHEPGLFVASFLSTGDDAFKIVKSEINSSNCSLLISIPYMYTAWRID